VKQPDADREDLVEAPPAEIQILELGDEELGPPGLHVPGVPAPRRIGHLA
jgi:hypothetical protein